MIYLELSNNMLTSFPQPLVTLLQAGALQSVSIDANPLTSVPNYVAAIDNQTNSVNGVLQSSSVFNFACETNFAELDNLLTPQGNPVLTTACGITCSAPLGQLLTTSTGSVGDPARPIILGPTDTGYITSDGTPFASNQSTGPHTILYRNAQECGWTLQAPIGKHVTLSFVNLGVFSLDNPNSQQSVQCDVDWVQLFDGPSLASRTFLRPVAAGQMEGQPARFCSSNNFLLTWAQFITEGNESGDSPMYAPKLGESFTSANNTVTIRFHADFSGSFFGFAIAYSVH